MSRNRGFTSIELLVVIAALATLAALVSLPLATMQSAGSLGSATDMVVDSIRRAQVQAASGYYQDSWGVHFSDSDGCALPATKIHVYRGAAFTSATDTIDTIDLPSGATVTALSLGGGCDVRFLRFRGTTSNAGTVTVSGRDGTRSVVISAYGRVEQQ